MKRAAKLELALLIGLALSLLWGTWADRTQQELSEKEITLDLKLGL